MPVLLFGLTFVSAVLASAVPQVGGHDTAETINRLLTEPQRLLRGLPFAATLMAILLAHEMGHFLAARRHRVPQTWPYFIPAPTVFGTLGALILMKAQPPNRRVLLSVGMAGPWAGLAVAIPATAWGLAHSTPLTDVLPTGTSITLGSSALFYGLTALFAPPAGMIDLHPVAVAGWVGLFITSLNLIPAAQLDGGHVAYALFGRHQERISLAIVLLILVLGALLSLGEGGLTRGVIWIFWAFFLFILGIGHPPVADPTVQLTRPHRVIGYLTLLVFISTFTPVPVVVPDPDVPAGAASSGFQTRGTGPIPVGPRFEQYEL